ncbi:MAG: SLBB domain-containing protein [Fidelibacterota bacterium]
MIRILFIGCLLFSGIFSQTSAEIKRQIRNSGMSESQLRQLAKQRGLRDNEIDAKVKELGFKARYQDNRYSRQGVDSVRTSLPQEKVIQIINDSSSLNEFPTHEITYFGYKMFQRDPAIFQGSELGAVDPGYNIGPGDEIIIMLWGETQFREIFSVDREGFIFIPEAGQVFVNGLTMKRLESKLFNVLSQKYSSLVRANGGKPTTFLDVSLGNLRPIRILVVGEVDQPGAYQVGPATTIFTSLYYFNGPTNLGSLRNIQLIRNGHAMASIDFYDYLLSGKKINDLRLQLDDTVFLPPRGKTVTIRGEIKRPAIYELKENEGLLNLITIAGDFTSKAYLDRIQIDRIVPSDQRELLGMDRMLLDVSIHDLKTKSTDMELMDGDTINIFSVQTLIGNYVDISGNVYRPGRFEYTEKLNVYDLVEMADGLVEDTYLDMAHLIRRNDDLTKEILEFNLGNAINQAEMDNLELQPFDSLVVFNKNKVFNIFKTVAVTGAVKYPDRYNYYEGMTINDLLIQAGGFAENVYRAKLEIMRVNPDSTNKNEFGYTLEIPEFLAIEELQQNDGNSPMNKLHPYDVVFVRPDPYFKLDQNVEVTGAVVYPGKYALASANDFISDLIQRAGGFYDDAYPEASSLNRDSIEVNIDLNKIMEQPGSSIDFTLLAGDVIHVSKHPNMVYVHGEVNNPGAFKYKSGKSVKDYINEAGGLTSDADKNGISIRYPNGEGNEVKRLWLSPPVMDGSIITISTYTRERVDKTELAKEITAIIANLAQVITTIIIISKL